MANGANRLLVNGLDARRLLVTDDPRPTFTLRAGPDGAPCTHLQVRVCAARGGEVWDSGPLPFTGPHLQYAGPPLRPKTAYRAVMDLYADGAPAGSAAADFETGFLGGPWAAGWIEPAQQPALPEQAISFSQIFAPGVDDGRVTERLRPCPELERTFTCEAPPARARLYASAHGLYALWLNGAPVGKARLAPETSAYQERLYYQCYDVAPLLKPGENTLRVLLADGWWAGRIGISGDSCQYGDRLGFIMQLELEDAAGAAQTVLSDEQFRCRGSHIRYADLFVGEKHDYTAQPEGWQACAPVAYGTEALVAQPIAPVVDWAALEPRFFTTPKGELMADFGQVLAGVAEISVDLPAPATLTLDCCEVLDAGGNYFKNIIGRNKDQRDVAACPAGKTVFRPLFTYHGFRYVRITGVTRQHITGLRALALGTALQGAGSFSCVDPQLNQLQQNICWSTRGNMVSVPTDCPQREKMGWTGDIQVFAATACFNYDMSNFLDGWLANLRAEQAPDGEVPIVVPCYPVQARMEREKSGYNSSPAWGDACVLVPLQLYRSYGDARVLRDNLAAMEGWLGFIKRTAAQKPESWDALTPAQQASNPYLWTKGHQFGDWLIPSLRRFGHQGTQAGVQATYKVVGSCFYAVTVRAYLEVLRALAQAGEADLQAKIDEHEALLQNIRTAVREEYVREDGSIEGGLQGLYVMALYAGVGDAAQRGKMVAQLARLIEENNGCLDTGFVSTPYLLDVLADNGRRDLAYRLLWQQECPGWLYQVQKGATTLWENWAAIQPDGTVTNSSFNHYALGCVGDWMYRRLGGIAPAAPGYRQVRLAPLFDAPLDGAKATHDSLYGAISSEWRREDGRITWQVRLPDGVTAEAVLPVAPEDAAACLAPGSAAAGFRGQEGATVALLGGGEYTFRFAAPLVPGGE